jgi:ATP-dependent helicase HepA
LVQGLPKETAIKVANQQRPLLEKLTDKASKMIEKTLVQAIEHAKQRLTNHLGGELARLKALQQKNPLVKQSEIDELYIQLEKGITSITKTRADLIGLRIVVAT